MVARRLRRTFSASTLTRLRQMPACDALALLATHVKSDPTFRPVKDDQSQRWHLCTRRGDFEIVTTGPKWYDTRARHGGGGAIDLAIYLLDVTIRRRRQASDPQGQRLMVQIIRKASLPTPDEVAARTRDRCRTGDAMSPCASLGPPDSRFCSPDTGS
jgi:hypothetical protein